MGDWDEVLEQTAVQTLYYDHLELTPFPDLHDPKYLYVEDRIAFGQTFRLVKLSQNRTLLPEEITRTLLDHHYSGPLVLFFSPDQDFDNPADISASLQFVWSLLGKFQSLVKGFELEEQLAQISRLPKYQYTKYTNFLLADNPYPCLVFPNPNSYLVSHGFPKIPNPTRQTPTTSHHGSRL